MSEQRMKILEMLSEGKITVDEAQKLLESVTDPAAHVGQQNRGSVGDWAHEQPFKPYEGIEDEEQTQQTMVIDLSKVKVGGTVLSGANLNGAKLDGADLTGAVLGGADLENADLSNANLSGTVLSGANLRNADLHNADLSGSVLPKADFEGVHHPGLQLSGMVLSAGCKYRDGKLEFHLKTEPKLAGTSPQVMSIQDEGKVVTLVKGNAPAMTAVKVKAEPPPTPKPPSPPEPPPT